MSGAETFRVKVTGPDVRGADMVLARAFDVPLEVARQLLAEPRVLPKDLGEGEARLLLGMLRKLGLECDLVRIPGPSRAECPSHPGLASERPCQECRELVCVLCRDANGQALCGRCAALRKRRARAKWARVSVLLVVLVGIVLWGVGRHRTRERRLEWERPLRVAVVLLSREEVSEPVRAAWREGMDRLDAWAGREAGRYGLGLERPIDFELLGPVDPGSVRFEEPEEGWWKRLQQGRRLTKELAQVDAAAGVKPPEWDARIYVMLEDAEAGPRLVEGMAEAGGTVGLVRGVRGDEELTLELTAVAHEFFHCLGAQDAYDAEGHARVPQGLVDPSLQPPYPQSAAEVMVGEVPVAEGEGRLAESLDEVGVGPFTARSLRWTE